LLRRAADYLRTHGSVPIDRFDRLPRVLFAGRVDDIKTVAMTLQTRVLGSGPAKMIAVYTEVPRARLVIQSGKADPVQRINVNPVSGFPLSDNPMEVAAIRLLDARGSGADQILLPPAVAEIETGPLDTPTKGWQPAHPDSRGVLKMPMPPASTPQSEQAVRFSPTGGIRYKDTAGYFAGTPTVTVQETFSEYAALLPRVQGASPDGTIGGQPLSDADWCAIRAQAEDASTSGLEYLRETYADIASGPLPDGGGTGDVIRRTASGPQSEDYRDVVVLSRPDASCASAMLHSYRSMAGYLSDGHFASALAWPDPAAAHAPSAVATLWESPAKHSYLVVAGVSGVAKLRVSGPVSASANGRWLVIPLPDKSGPVVPPPLVEAFDAAGHNLR